MERRASTTTVFARAFVPRASRAPDATSVTAATRNISLKKDKADFPCTQKV
jgi:hypothetical protein